MDTSTAVEKKSHLTPEAKEIVKKAIANIRKYPDQFNMSHWTGKCTIDGKNCGTSACLAGHIVLAAIGRDRKQIYSEEFVPFEAVEKRKVFKPFLPELQSKVHEYGSRKGLIWMPELAAALLGTHYSHDLAIDGNQGAFRLFHADQWPEPFKTEYYALINPADQRPSVMKKLRKKRAVLAIRRLQHFLKTGE